MAAATADLPTDHPGFHDPAYRTRRAAIAAIGERYRPGERIPMVRYTDEEQEVWRLVSGELAGRHRRDACRSYRNGARALALDRQEIPQLQVVADRLDRLTGFRIEPVPGLVPTRTFYGALARRRFLSTQYVRHPSVPFYTPEPDVIHEVIGHANMLASPALADLSHAAGAASTRTDTDEALQFFSRVFWFTLEFGVVWEEGELRAYGAGLLSSAGELDRFRQAEIRPFDLLRMGTLDYDITTYQPVLFAAPSFARLENELGLFFEGYDDDAFGRLMSTSSPVSRSGRRPRPSR